MKVRFYMIRRREEIVNAVNREGQISLAELKEMFPEVSEVTLRKDLQYLNSTWQLVRVHGGAKSILSTVGDSDNYFARSKKNIEEKQLIAEKASLLIKPNSSVFIAGGSTCNELTKTLPPFPLYVFTDGLYTAIELAKLDTCTSTIIGGQIENNTLRASGPKLLTEFEHLHFDIAFIGTQAYSRDYGFSTSSSHTSLIHRTLQKCADKLVVLMDHTKVSQPVGPMVMPTASVHAVVSDGKLDAATLASFAEAGVTVY